MALYHGSRARIRPGSLVTPGQPPNPWGDTFDEHGRSVYVYASDRLDVARSYADAVKALGLRSFVYEVQPTGGLFHDGTGDVRSRHPFIVVRLIKDGE